MTPAVRWCWNTCSPEQGDDAARDMAPGSDLPDSTRSRLIAGFALAWVTFWLLMVMVGMQEALREGHDLWRLETNPSRSH